MESSRQSAPHFSDAEQHQHPHRQLVSVDSVFAPENRFPEWRRDEHNRFMQALETFGAAATGDEWEQIAAFVGTRSTQDVLIHGRRYLQQLMQQQPALSTTSSSSSGLATFDWTSGGELDDTPTGTCKTRARMFMSDSQNDPGNVVLVSTAAMTKAPWTTRARKTPPPSRFRQFQPQLYAQPPVSYAASGSAKFATSQAVAPHFTQTQQPTRKSGHGRRPKSWSFQEDKAFETALAGWSTNKPYSWAKIASALPGKTAKDVRNRYEKLLGDISCIELAPSPHSQTRSSSARSSAAGVSLNTHVSSLRRRATPPPPIETAAKAPAGLLALSLIVVVESLIIEFNGSCSSLAGVVLCSF